jgi:hypothetical protein
MDRDTQKAIQRLSSSVMQSYKGLQELSITGISRFITLYSTINVLTEVVMNFGLDKGWWTREEFEKEFIEVSIKVGKDYSEHQDKELERIKQEQAEGKQPVPMSGFKGFLVDTILDKVMKNDKTRSVAIVDSEKE